MKSQKSSKTSNLAIFSFILSISAILIAVYPYVRLNTPQEPVSNDSANTLTNKVPVSETQTSSAFESQVNRQIENLQDADTEFLYRLGSKEFAFSCENMVNISSKDLFSASYFDNLDRAMQTMNQQAVTNDATLSFPWKPQKENTNIVIGVCENNSDVYLFSNNGFELSGSYYGVAKYNTKDSTITFAHTAEKVLAIIQGAKLSGDQYIDFTPTPNICLGEGDLFTSCDSLSPQEQISRQFYQPTIRYHIPEGSIDTQK